MRTCPRCGRESEGVFAFCPHCGAELASGPAPLEHRKTVTVLFCDVTGSTALGESVDPEALRATLARYFERMKAIVEHHGGTVEKFIGDAVMAVFGVPQLHEDDALRACRAAVEMRDALPELGLNARIGVNTGEVVTGTAERLATGDAVNIAARLEQAAEPGDALLGEETVRLVRAAVEAEAVEPLAVKGKVEPVRAYRLVAMIDAPLHRQEAPMVGRRTELRRLRDAFEQATRDRTCQLFTVLGVAGVGKSRLAAEFLTDVDATVLRGRCLSYGEGITYWPVVESLRQLDVLPSDQAAQAALLSLLGKSEASTSTEEITWGFRKLLEEQARTRPVVCVFDDIHWGEETFLDLIEHVSDLSRDAPILLLCMARPDLLDKRPSWGGGKLNATTVLLEPLSAEEIDELLGDLGIVQRDLRARIQRSAEGNPLFAEEMLALVRESTDGEIEVPPTIHALLAARLDQLTPSERSVLECGAVEGRSFHRSAVQALAPNGSELLQQLTSLVRKELVRPDASQVPGDDAFRFRHQLIRDVAYEALPKSTRATLHERFALWLEERAPDLVELEQILGHHLEQAAGYKEELGHPDLELASRAGERLAAAGRRAFHRSDFLAAITLLERALELLRPVRLDIHLELDLARTHRQRRDFARAEAVAEAAATRAHEAGDPIAEELARIVAADAGALFRTFPPDLEARSRKLRDTLERAGDHAGLVYVWEALGHLGNFEGRFEEWAEAAEQAFRHAQIAGQDPGPPVYTMSLAMGPRPADEALRALDETLPESPPPRSLLVRAQLLAMLDRIDEAWDIGKLAGDRLREMTGGWMGGESYLAQIASCEENKEAEVGYLRRYCELLEVQGNTSELSTYAPQLGRALCALGRYDEAEPLAVRGRELGEDRDATTQAMWRQTQALVLSSRGEHAAAEQIVREAVAITEDMDSPNAQGDALGDLAEVLRAAGRGDEAAQACERALDVYGRKKNLAMVSIVRRQLEKLPAL